MQRRFTMNEQEKEIFRLSYLSESKKTKIFTQIIKDLINNNPSARPSENPQMTVIMGFPGSGKSSYAAQNHQNAIRLGKDDMLAYHPNLFKLNELAPVKLNSKNPDAYDAGQITNADGEKESLVENFAEEAFWVALDFCQNQGYDVVVDGLPSEEMLDIAEEAKEQGYQVDFVVPVVPKRLLEINVASRYEQGQKNFAEAQKGLRKANAEAVPHPYTKMRLAPEDIREAGHVIREAENLGYPLKVINPLSGQRLNDNQPADIALISELSRPLNEREQQYAQNKLQTLRAQQEKRGASRYDRYVVAAMERD